MKLCQECIKYMPDDALTCLSCGGGSWGVVEPDVCSQVPAVIVDDEPATTEAPEAPEAPATTTAPAIVRTRGKK